MDIFVSVLLLAVVAFLLVLLFTTAFILHSKRHPSYKPKGPYLLNTGERQFFEVLTRVIHSDLYVCPKVRLADIITVTLPQTDNSFWRKFNQISQKHVDFLICQRSDFAPVVIVELDGGSHLEPERERRDQLVDNALAEAGIRIVHVRAASKYDKLELRRLLVSH